MLKFWALEQRSKWRERWRQEVRSEVHAEMKPHLERVAREKGIALAELLSPDPQ